MANLGRDAIGKEAQNIGLQGRAPHGAARLTIVHITDVYILDNFPHLRTLIKKTKEQNPMNTVSMLTGDFLAPYLLSSVDKGAAMMKMLIKTPIDYLTWGNHEADCPHADVCKRCKEYHAAGGVWINSNMQDHAMMEYQKPYEVITVTSADGSHVRRVGLIGVLTDDPSLYKKFKAPGAFGGAKIDDPWETLRKYKRILEEEEKCDLVIPLEHLYEHEDERTLKEFNFPIVFSGHDHHRVDRASHGSRLLKPGSDAHYACVLDVTWEAPGGGFQPTFGWEMLKVADYEPDMEMLKEVAVAYMPLASMHNTELAPVPDRFRPLSSVNIRGQVTTIGLFICSLVHDAVHGDPHQHDCEMCMICGSQMRGECDYPPDSFFSLEDLKTVNMDNLQIEVVQMPGELIVKGVQSTRGSINRLFIQYDDGVTEVDGVVTKVNGKPIVPDKLYYVATTPGTLGDVPIFAKYFETHNKPSHEEFVPLEFELMSHCSRMIWKRIEALTRGHIEALDIKHIGEIGPEEIQAAMKRLGIHVADDEFSLEDYIIKLAGADHDDHIHLGGKNDKRHPVKLRDSS